MLYLYFFFVMHSIIIIDFIHVFVVNYTRTLMLLWMMIILSSRSLRCS